MALAIRNIAEPERNVVPMGRRLGIRVRPCAEDADVVQRVRATKPKLQHSGCLRVVLLAGVQCRCVSRNGIKRRVLDVVRLLWRRRDGMFIGSPSVCEHTTGYG